MKPPRSHGSLPPEGVQAFPWGGPAGGLKK